MKKSLLLLLVLGALSAAAVPALADDYKDNSLQIDNSRIEKEEELNFGAQAEGTNSLFDAKNQEKFEQAKRAQNQQLATEAGQLFSAINRPTDIYHEKELFQPVSQKLSKPGGQLGTDNSSDWDDFLPGLAYSGAVLLLLGLAVFVSYRINKGED